MRIKCETQVISRGTHCFDLGLPSVDVRLTARFDFGLPAFDAGTLFNIEVDAIGCISKSAKVDTSCSRTQVTSAMA